jgi:hypothetical protein
MDDYAGGELLEPLASRVRDLHPSRVAFQVFIGDWAVAVSDTWIKRARLVGRVRDGSEHVDRVHIEIRAHRRQSLLDPTGARPVIFGELLVSEVLDESTPYFPALKGGERAQHVCAGLRIIVRANRDLDEGSLPRA